MCKQKNFPTPQIQFSSVTSRGSKLGPFDRYFPGWLLHSPAWLPSRYRRQTPPNLQGEEVTCSLGYTWTCKSSLKLHNSCSCCNLHALCVKTQTTSFPNGSTWSHVPSLSSPVTIPVVANVSSALEAMFKKVCDIVTFIATKKMSCS